MTVPLKLKDSAAPSELQEFSSTEENYIAYQAGLHLASGDSSDVGSLALSVHGTENQIGSIVDTSFDSAVGTGGNSALLTFSTVTTPLKQTRGTITPSGANERRPVYQALESGQRVIREMSDTDMGAMLDRINSRIFTSDYPGSYKLGTSTPTGGYTLVKSGLANDTRTDGTSVSHNLYRRTSMTAPTTVRPFAVKRSSGASGSYQGLQVMTDDQIKYSIGTRLQNKISSSTTGVGSYKIYSASSGTPANNGLGGTWVAKGTITDTRQAIVDANYTRSRSSTYARASTTGFEGNYVGTRDSNFARTSVLNYARNFSATYTKTRTSLYTVTGFIGDFIGDYTSTSTVESTRNSTNMVGYTTTTSITRSSNYSRAHEYLGNFVTTFTGRDGVQFVGNFTRSRTSINPQYARNFVGNYVGDFSRAQLFTGNFTGNYTGDFLRNRMTNKDGAGIDYARDFLGQYARSFDRVRESNYERNAQYQVDVFTTRDSNRVRTASFEGNFLGEYQRGYSRDFFRTTTYEVGYSRSYQRGGGKQGFQYYTRAYTGTLQYIRNRYSSTGAWGSFQSDNTSTIELKNWVVPVVTALNAGNNCYFEIEDNSSTQTYSQWGTVPFVINMTTTSPSNSTVGNKGIYFNELAYESITGYDGTNPTFGQWKQAEADYKAGTNKDLLVYLNKITRIKTSTYNLQGHTGSGSGPAAEGWEYERGTLVGLRNGSTTQNTYSWRKRRVYPIQSGRLQYSGPPTGPSRDDYSLVGYVGNYAAAYPYGYARNYFRNFTREPTRTSTVDYAGDFLGDFTGNFLGDFTGDYTRDFQGDYNRDYERTRSSNYLGKDAYGRDFAGNFTGNYARDYNRTFEGNYSRTFAGNYAGNYNREYVGNYARTFAGNYAGQTIGSGNTNIETYTLYVRTA